MNDNTPWALNMNESNELYGNDREIINIEREVDSTSEINTQNINDDTDIYLSDWKLANKRYNTAGEPVSHSESNENVKVIEKTTQTGKQQVIFHPASQIKLYNKAKKKAALIRHGHYHHGLISVVIDMCFSHYGNARDWQQVESVALSIDELLTIFGQFKASHSVNLDLQFHAQTTSPVNIMVTADKLIIKSGDLHLTGKVANKVKFMAMVDSALRVYVKEAFPNSSYDEFLKFY